MWRDTILHDRGRYADKHVRYGDTLNINQVSNPLERLGEGRREATDPPEGPPSKLWWTELNHTVPCMMLEAPANRRRKTSLRPRFDTVDQVAS
ncbi:hypothetical protein TNCV_5099381 [Trichonephila clavipes]|uniref:Uncharacterized protein n=1 Tax=Trichonephila clavipes TaxID=2585209 RepID=A0A8X6V2E7_TRICX|nr:hypothetical protein TNCV_5099381 [Trichonephila clavipes]